MGTLNEAWKVLAMMMKLQIEWKTLAKERRLNIFCIEIIVDDVLLYGRTTEQLLAYFRAVMYVLKHHRNTLKLKMC